MTPFHTYDDFDIPKDEVDDFYVPKEAKQKSRPKIGPAPRLVEKFYNEWSIARCQNTTWGVAYNNRAAITKVFKNLLEDHSEQEISEMIVMFFKQALAGRMYLGGQEMWRDFLNNRAEVWRIVRESGTVSKPVALSDNSAARAALVASNAQAKAREAKKAAREAERATERVSQ
jgi:hypothetical protein